MRNKSSLRFTFYVFAFYAPHLEDRAGPVSPPNPERVPCHRLQFATPDGPQLEIDVRPPRLILETQIHLADPALVRLRHDEGLLSVGEVGARRARRPADGIGVLVAHNDEHALRVAWADNRPVNRGLRMQLNHPVQQHVAWHVGPEEHAVVAHRLKVKAAERCDSHKAGIGRVRVPIESETLEILDDPFVLELEFRDREPESPRPAAGIVEVEKRVTDLVPRFGKEAAAGTGP